MKALSSTSTVAFMLLNLMFEKNFIVTAFGSTKITDTHHVALHLKGASPMRFRKSSQKEFDNPLYLLPEQAKELVEAAKRCELMDDSFHVGVHEDLPIPRHKKKISPPNDSKKTENLSFSERSHTGAKKQRGQDNLFGGLFGKGEN